VISSEESVDPASITLMEDIDEPLAEALIEAGYKTREDLAKAKEEDLIEFEGIDDSLAKKLIEKATVGESEA